MKDYSNKSARDYVGCFVEFPFCFRERGSMSYTIVPRNNSLYGGEREKLTKKFKRIAIADVSHTQLFLHPLQMMNKRHM